MHILWIILVGFVAGIIARNLLPGPNNPSGFILTTVLGIARAFVATYLGQRLGWYRIDQGAGLSGRPLALCSCLRLASASGDAHRHRSDDRDPLGPRRWL
jgi:uncharacterized membrane protein YeaQ/YmgE (transglycosylase-associated protein family)